VGRGGGGREKEKEKKTRHGIEREGSGRKSEVVDLLWVSVGDAHAERKEFLRIVQTVRKCQP
jgi:hypothetical protein